MEEKNKFNEVVDLKKIEATRNNSNNPEAAEKKNEKSDTKPIVPEFEDKKPSKVVEKEAQLPKKQPPQKVANPQEDIENKPKKRGCFPYLLGSCSILLLLNLILLSFLVYYIGKAAVALETQDTEEIVEAINESIGPKTEEFMENFVEKYIDPDLLQESSKGSLNNSGTVKENGLDEDEDFKVGYPD